MKYLSALALAAVVCVSAGCLNGRGIFGRSACDACNPPAQPSCGPGCATQGDPYLGSNYGGATINAPAFDSYGGANLGGTIVPPTSSDMLPGPTGN